jgi:hypothetical protein
MAMYRFGSASVVKSSVAPSEWTKKVCCHKGKKDTAGACSCGSACRVKVAKTVLAKYSPDKYLLSHCSIMAAVDTELADPKNPKSNWLIHPAYSQFVNNNGDAWTKQMLAASYKTFIGANNYVEHVQIPELAKGKIIDAALREVPIGKDKNGKDLTTYYVDILVATDRKHKTLIASIESGETSKLSMGCKIAHSTCSKCGKRAVDETQACSHVRYEKNNTFVDDLGVTRKVAELCGDANEPDSVVFIDGSWVKNPAFTGAVRRNTVAPSNEIMAKLEHAHNKGTYTVQDNDYLKAAAEGDPPPEADAPPPEADAPPPEADAPPPEEGADAPPPEEGAGDTTLNPPGDVPPPPPEMPSPEDDIKTWKEKVKKKLLDELGDEIVDTFVDELDVGGGGPRELDTLDENLIQPTASRMLKSTFRMKKAWDRYLNRVAGHLEKKHFDRLKYGTYMLLTSNDMTILKDYGYNRRDFLAVMSFLDGCFKKSMPVDMKKALIKVGTIQNRKAQNVLKDLTWFTGRKLEAEESAKALTWLKVMSNYPE